MEPGQARHEPPRLHEAVWLIDPGRNGLRSATAAAEQEAGAVHGRSMLPVLAGRSADVDGAVMAAYPHLVDVNLSISNREGWIAGRVAADLAHLGPEQQLPGVAV